MRMISTLSGGLLATSIGFGAIGQAAAQSAEGPGDVGVAQARYFCLPHGDAVSKLEQRFEERVIAMGVGQDQKSVVELFVSQKGTWTILMTLNNGLSCITAAGQKWTDMVVMDDLVS